MEENKTNEQENEKKIELSKNAKDQDVRTEAKKDESAENLVTRGEKAAAKLAEIEQRLDEKIKALEDLNVKFIMSGKAKSAFEEKPKEDSPVEYANKLMNGQISYIE